MQAIEPVTLYDSFIFDNAAAYYIPEIKTDDSRLTDKTSYWESTRQGQNATAKQIIINNNIGLHVGLHHP